MTAAGQIFVVSGVPGAGKSTLARSLAHELGAPLISLDAIKEALFDAGFEGDRSALRLAAEQEMFARLREASGEAVVDVWIAPQRDTERVAAGFANLGRPVVEVVCRVPADLAVARYAGRHRGAPHLPADQAMLARVRTAVDEFTPMGVGAHVDVDTSGPVDVRALVTRLSDFVG